MCRGMPWTCLLGDCPQFAAIYSDQAPRIADGSGLCFQTHLTSRYTLSQFCMQILVSHKQTEQQHAVLVHLLMLC